MINEELWDLSNDVIRWSDTIEMSKIKQSCKKLNLASNYITDVDMYNVVRLVDCLPKCNEIDLSYNPFTYDTESIIKLLDNDNIEIVNVCYTEFSDYVLRLLYNNCWSEPKKSKRFEKLILLSSEEVNRKDIENDLTELFRLSPEFINTLLTRYRRFYDMREYK